jgi:glycerophosphoryl diester phosphodiesterase
MLADLLGPPPWIVGHRGACAEAAENTIESFRRAIEQRAVMIELDVQLTGDGRLIVAHDWDLQRTAGSPLVVEDSAAADIREANVAAYFAGSRPARAPLLGELFESVPGEFPLNLELKRRHADRVRFAETFAGEVKGRTHTVISSFDWALLREVQRRIPDALIAPLCEEPTAELLAIAGSLRAAAVHTGHDRVTREFVTTAAARGWPTLVYTVDDPTLARRQFEMGVAGIFTNAPGRMRVSLQVS